MAQKGLQSPVLFLIFNRPDTTQRVFNEIRKAKPRYLYVGADGPRAEREGEAEKCRVTRAIIDQVDWDCKVYTLFRDSNLGCKAAVSSAITWFFENVEEGIIVEDDCLPNQSFFRFCDYLLRKYKDDERIMAISGTNLLKEWKSDSLSYFFSYYGGIWGWASWKRAWALYDVRMELWKKWSTRKKIKNLLDDREQWKEMKKIFRKVYKDEISTWDYQWVFTKFVHSGLSIIPARNLVTNIGWQSESTHTSTDNKNISNLPVYEMDFPLHDNGDVRADRLFDRRFAEIGNSSN